MRWQEQSVRARFGRLSVETVLSWFMKLSFAAIIPYLVVEGRNHLEAGHVEMARDSFVVAGGAALALVISLTPSILSRSAHITLPWEVDFIITLALYLHVAVGGAMGFYQKALPIPYDKFLHFVSTAMISVLAFMFVFTLYYTRRLRLSFVFMVVFILMTALGLGAFWEILEYGLDKIAGTKAQLGLDDTMTDLILDLCGGIIVAVGGTLYARRAKPRHQRRIAMPMAQLLGYLPLRGGEGRIKRQSAKKERGEKRNDE